MNVEEAIRERRSIRRYSDKEVKNDVLMKILSLARFAPSSGNIQNWRFIVVRDPEKKKGIARACLNQRWMVQAPAHIVICNDLTAAKRAYGERGENLYSIQNCAAAAQNLMLAAESEGLVTCWVGSFDAEGIKRILNIPTDINPEIIITVGYKTEKQTSMTGRHDLSQLLFFETWGNRIREGGIFPLEKLASKETGIIGKIRKAVKKE